MFEQAKSKKSPIKMSAPNRNGSGSLWGLIFLTTIIQLLPLSIDQQRAVVCQDFEDLNTKLQLQQQPFSRQSQSSALTSSSSNNNNRQINRPLLSSRFAPSSPVGQQQLNAQASSSASVISAPPAGLQAQPTSAASNSQTSNIEQLMKNALARTAAVAAPSQVAESRQDSGPPVALEPATSGNQQQASSASPQITSRSGQTQASSSAAAAAADKTADASETSTSETPLALDDGDKSTTAGQGTTNAHDTVYSDQRFANLFARRNNNAKRNKLQPMEQVKAKPTLPSFIKSPPDPKQFNAAQQAAAASERPVQGSPSNGNPSFASQRLQQQNQGRLPNQQKKPAITSTSAANANLKRNNTLNGKQTQAPSGLPRSNTNQKSATSSTSKPAVSAASNNNPFGRGQNSNNSDPANVIAMARKRLLANNALESAKLKQQQNSKQTN